MRIFRDNWPVDRYVETLATTPHLLDKAARMLLGSGVKRVVSERRLLEAKRLLLFTVRTVEDIVYEIGFDDPAYFSKVLPRTRRRSACRLAAEAVARR